MPGAINLPLMMDDERAAVGTCYKRQGADAALALGHRLVCGDIRQQRLEAWKAAYQRFPTGICAARAAVSGHISYNVGCKKQGLTARLLKAAIKRCARQQFRRPGNWRKTDTFNWRLYGQRQNATGTTTAQRRGSGRSRASSRLLFGRTLNPSSARPVLKTNLPLNC